MISTEQIQDLLDAGGNVVSQDGSKIGNIGQLYLDDQTGKPEWVTVTTGLFGRAESFVPLVQGEVVGDDIQVPYDKDKVKDAPRLDDREGHLSPDQEQELYRYYGLDYSETASESGLPAGGRDASESGFQTSERDAVESGVVPGGWDRTKEQQDLRDRTGDSDVVGRDVSGPTTDDAMTRSEEQFNVGTEVRESGKVRLRKYVVTENVTQTVPVSREEVRVEREPITDANRDEALSGGDFTEEEHEVTLHEERPVVEKEAVPVERLRLDTETVTDEEQVTDEVRKERIETEDDQGLRGDQPLTGGQRVGGDEPFGEDQSVEGDRRPDGDERFAGDQRRDGDTTRR